MTCIENAQIAIDLSSVEKVFRTPRAVLQNVDAFWREEPAYQMAQGWAPPGYPIHKGGFRDAVEELTQLSLAEREQHPHFLFAKALVESLTRIRSEAIPHICSYLPKETRLVATVFLACFIFLGKDKPQFVPSAFIYEGSSCLNVSSNQWGDDKDSALNEIVHELYHNGYEKHQSKCPLTEEMSRQQLLDHIAWQLHNEGMATYVAYKAQHLFHAASDKDYPVLDTPGKVDPFIGNLRSLVLDIKTKPPTEAKETIIKVGITDRAFYVVGAHMARTIETAAGKAALIQSVVKGPQHFLETYNTYADSDGILFV
jgi:hypothetical protein